MSEPNTEMVLMEPEMAAEMDAPQLELFLGDDKPGKIDYSKPTFSYNAERLWRDRPDVAKAAIKLLAEPREVMPYRRIMGRLHVSYHLLRQLEMTQGSAIAKEKKTLGDLAYTATEVYLDQAIELAPTMKSGKDAMIAAGIAGDKFLQFRGEAMAKIEINAKVDINAKIDNAYHKFIEEFRNVKRAEVVEIVPPTLAGGVLPESKPLTIQTAVNPCSEGAETT